MGIPMSFLKWILGGGSAKPANPSAPEPDRVGAIVAEIEPGLGRAFESRAVEAAGHA